jgi:excisionase family DNA binding protein
VAPGGIGEQALEETKLGNAADSDTVAPSGYGETPFGAPVVRDLPPDPGPHERLLTVRQVAARLGISTALVYRLSEKQKLQSVRIGGAIRFHETAVQSFLAALESVMR